MSYETGKLMNLQDGQELLKALDQRKADKVGSAVSGNFAGLDSNGNLTDSGSKAADFATAASVGTVPTGKTVQGQIDTLDEGLNKGTFEDLTSGNAQEVLSDRGDTDITPYVFRQTGGAKKAYNREMLKKVVGGTVAWNQLVQNGNFESVDHWNAINCTVSVSNNKATLVQSEGTTELTIGSDNSTNIKTNHKLLISADVNSSVSDVTLRVGVSPGNSQHMVAAIVTLMSGNNQIREIIDSDKNETRAVAMRFLNLSGLSATFVVSNYTIFDLTVMFGYTIADAIYAMEQATAGSGVAFFRSLFPNDYYAYDAGSLQSVQVASKKTTGKNLIDFSNFDTTLSTAGSTVEHLSDGKFKTYNGRANAYIKYIVPVVPNTTYEFKAESKEIISGSTGIYADVMIYEYNGSTVGSLLVPNKKIVTPAIFTPTSKYVLISIVITGGNGAVAGIITMPQLEFGSIATAYEPYQEHTYPFDSDLVLRGIPKLDSDGNLYYDGDEYTPDGSVKRKYGVLTNQTAAVGDTITLTGAKSDLTDIITSAGHLSDVGTISGTTLTLTKALSGDDIVYELATPDTSGTADPYRELEICSRYGTEEFVDAGVTASTPTRDVSIPVGTESFYPVNVFDYIEELTQPDHDMVADALIPANTYFMVGNTLYYSTSQIQAGGTINPGTNCTAKTLAEVLNELNA